MKIKHTHNPLSLEEEATYHGEGLSPNQVIEQEHIIFTHPVVLMVNGEPRLRADWDKLILESDEAVLVELPAGIETVIIGALTWGMVYTAAAAAVIGTILSTLVNMFFGPGDPSQDQPEARESAPAYNLASGTNQLKIGKPFVEQFGRFICYPDLIQQNYVEYIGNEQYLYFIGIIGVGEYDIEEVYIDKTPMDDYGAGDVSYAIIEPDFVGGAPTIVPNIVYTCQGITGQELSTDWLTVAVSPAGTSVSDVGFDVVFPAGLVEFNEKGNGHNEKVTILTEVRIINDKGEAKDENGSPTSWVTLINKEFKQDETHPLRYSLKKPVATQEYDIVTGLTALYRYEFRIRRTNARSYKGNRIDNCIIEALRGYGPEHPAYGDVTLLEVKVKATDVLNNSAASKINVISTRKLEAVTASGFGAKAATRSIVDACAYIVTAWNGGNQNDDVLDFASLYDLKTQLATQGTEGNFFDYRFADKGLALEACSIIAKCGRSIPIVPGGKFTLVRDEAQILPTQIYTDDDYTPGSLTFDNSFRTDDDSSCVEVEYVSPDSWRNEIVQCYEEGVIGDALNPTRVKLLGCCSRQHAWEEGMYMFWDDSYNRTAISFTTGLKGLIPQPGDMIYVSSRQIDWGQTGVVAHRTDHVLYLSEPVDFDSEPIGKLLLVEDDTDLTTIDGEPIDVTPGPVAHSVTVNTDDRYYTTHDDGKKASKYIFGKDISEILRVRVLRIVPSSSTEIQVIGSIITDSVYGDPGPVTDLAPIEIPLPDMDDIAIEYEGYTDPNHRYSATWKSGRDEFRLELDTGSGYVLLVDNLEEHAYVFDTTAIGFDLKVMPYISGSPSGSESTRYDLPAAPVNLVSVDDDKTFVRLSWDAVASADSYQIRVEDDDNETIWTESTEDSDADIKFYIPDIQRWLSTEESTGSKVYPSTEFFVSTRIGVVVGPESVGKAWQLLAPLAPANLAAFPYEEGDTQIKLQWDEVIFESDDGGTQVQGYCVYKSANSGFNPKAGEGTLCRTTTATNTIIQDIVVGDTPIYFKVAAFTRAEANFESLTYSSQLQVDTYQVPEADLLALSNTWLTSVSSNLVEVVWTGLARKFKVQDTSPAFGTPPESYDVTYDNYIHKSIVLQGIIEGASRDVHVEVTPYRETTPITAAAKSITILKTEFTPTHDSQSGTVFMKTYDDADLSGIPSIIKIYDGINYLFVKAYPTISASINPSSDNVYTGVGSYVDADVSGAAKVFKVLTNATSIYYCKCYGTVSAEVTEVSGSSIQTTCFVDDKVSGAARIAKIELNDSGPSVRYFKVYNTKG